MNLKAIDMLGIYSFTESDHARDEDAERKGDEEGYEGEWASPCVIQFIPRSGLNTD